MSSTRNTTFLASVVELVWKYTRRYPVDAAVVGGTAVAATIAGSYLAWTVGTVIVLTLLSPLVKWKVAQELWLHRHRRMLAGESMRWPGRRAALAFRKRDTARRADLRKQFEAVMQSNGFVNAAKVAPALRKMTSTPTGALTCDIYPGKLATKGGLRAIMGKRDEIAEICGADGGLRIAPFGRSADSVAPGAAHLTFHYEKQTWPTLPIQELPPAPVERVSIGNDEDLQPAHFPLVLSMLLVAMTGKGKSKAIWTLLVGVAVKVKHRLFTVDPKGGQEMGALEPLVNRGWVGNRKVDAYADNSEAGAYRVIMAAEAAMKEQQRALRAAGISEWREEHAEQFPMIVLVIDEMLEFLGKINAANKPGKAAEAALLTILSQGRASGTKVIMASQASDKEILGSNRTLISVRFVMGTENPTQTGMAFGDMKAEEYGATCSQINEPGVGFMKVDGERGYRKVRVALVEQHDIADFVDTGLPANMGTSLSNPADVWQPVANYRYFTSADCVIDGRRVVAGQLAYVGITSSPVLRHKQHGDDYAAGDAKHEWVRYVDMGKRPLITYAHDREEALRIEREEIRKHAPFGNIMENGGNPWLGQGPVGFTEEESPRGVAARFHLPRRTHSVAFRTPTHPDDATEPQEPAPVEPVSQRVWPPKPLPVPNGHKVLR